MPGEIVRIDLAHDERHGGVHPPGARVVDDRGAALRGLRRQCLRRVATCAEQRDVDTLERVRRRFADRVGGAGHVDLAPGAAGAGEEAQFAVRELALEQHPDHRPADDTGRADDCHRERLPGHVGHGSAVVLIRSGTAGV